MNGRFLLDTNIVIALFAGDADVAASLVAAEEVFIPAVVIGELFYGARKSGRPDFFLIIHSTTPSFSTASLNGSASYSGEDHSCLLRIMLLTTSSFSSSTSYRLSFNSVRIRLSSG